MNILPKARNSDIVIQDIGEELMIYDLQINKVFCLNKISTVVFQNCDGETDFESLISKHKLTKEIILLALDQLQRENLINKELIINISKRNLLKRIMFVSVTLPLITSFAAPAAAQAQSSVTCVPRDGTCQQSSDCCPQYCRYEPTLNFIGCLGGTCRQIASCPV